MIIANKFSISWPTNAIKGIFSDLSTMEWHDYSGLQGAIRRGEIIIPDDILRYVGINRLFRDAGLPAYSWADRRWSHPLLFKIGEVQQLAKRIGINWIDLIDLFVSNFPVTDNVPQPSGISE